MAEQVWIPGGEFLMGSDSHYPDEGPIRRVGVEGFWIDSTPVTNSEFSRFVAETGHVTAADVAPKAEDYPGASSEDLVPGSLVFTMTDGPVDLRDHHQWWAWVHGADWRHPTGPGSSIEGMDDHPVVHVAYQDAAAYADWAGRELPTEAEWEIAARGGLDGAEFVWGEGDPQDGPEPKANTWQGRFPFENTEVDGWTRTSPVGSYEPNGYGLYDIAGNVWEWTSDWYADRSGESEFSSSCCAPNAEPSLEGSYDPGQSQFRIPRRVIKGGSHLCTVQYCFRYRPAARQPQMIDTSTSHLGFRCITRP
jgi:formylglycine-generating enzyme required for sulfatase activity